MTVAPASSGARGVLVAGRLVVVVGVLLVAASLAVRPAARQESAGIGLATVMVGMMIVLLGNYLRHAAARAAARPPVPTQGPDGGPDGAPAGGTAQPSSVPTTDTNDTISPG